ncbi:hypothetical protein [Flaviaesturariibacter aridisoli]|uniref:Uncharacterized protein n=1 Tax=Flaviaesturariibacter aridisoli TaxID=2545761 RepID=A0A4R4E013_9BACT|nr:hypothetical protein [Flaviaesturariibacter aridisoli]TCZ67185.1 hypothetical protein E0486_16035 [Flaviaesturariibacter aridisoli]
MKNTFLTAAAILALAFGANAQSTNTQQTNTTSTVNTPGTPTVPDPADAQTGTSTATPNTSTTTTTTTTAPAATTATATATAPATRSYGSTADSIHAKYQYLPMPQAWTAEKAFPVIGTYQLAGADAAAAPLTITLDSTSKGIVWISGLPQGTVKAYLAKSPATYRIIPQKSASGKLVPEGTLYFAPETNTLNIALGAPYNAQDPTAIFPVQPVADTMAVDATVASAPAVATVKVKHEGAKSKTKSKSKVTFYTATKVNALNNTGSNAAFGQQLDQATKQQ